MKRSIRFDIIHQRGDPKQAEASKQARNDEPAQDHSDSKVLLAFRTDRRDEILQMKTNVGAKGLVLLEPSGQSLGVIAGNRLLRWG